MSDHKAAKNAASAAVLATCFLGVGTEDDPNKIRPANAEDWKRCVQHPIHPIPRPAGQTYAANFAANWFDGIRVVIIWGPVALLATACQRAGNAYRRTRCRFSNRNRGAGDQVRATDQVPEVGKV